MINLCVIHSDIDEAYLERLEKGRGNATEVSDLLDTDVIGLYNAFGRQNSGLLRSNK
jgi:hypothetical protein